MAKIEAIIPVITGDIIRSQQVAPGERSKLTGALQGISDALTEAGIGISSIDLFRGDSYQIILEDASMITDASVLLRVWFRRISLTDGGSLDTRLGMGIGPVEFANPEQSLSDGTAFRHAAEALETTYSDKLSQVRFKSTSTELDDHINAIFVAIEPIFSGLTAAQSHSLWWSLQGMTHSEIATKIDVAQSTVTRALHSAHEKHLTYVRHYMHGLLKTYLG